jgi:MFS transporter, FSR family, fosmidomycin resistance protein
MAAAATEVSEGSYGTMALVGGAHSISHFFQLAVPVLFPLIKGDLNVGYAELGLLATLFYVASGLCQSGSGFVVDHLGARKLLFSGIGVLCGSILLCGLAPSYPVLLVLMTMAGVGNSVFHPADYAILNSSIREGWLGRAYGIHTLGGNLGWALAPMTVFGLAGLAGWRAALIIVGLLGLAALVALMTQSALLLDGSEERHRDSKQPLPGLGSIFFSPAIMLCFVYFVLLAIATIGVQNFLPAILLILHSFPLSVGSSALTAFLLGSSAGTIAGALMADRTRRHNTIIAGGLGLAAAAIAMIGYVDVSGLVIATLAFGGFALGITLPSRDMLVRRVTPRGASGRVFGFVYSGLDAGSALAPVTIGILLDHGATRTVLWLLAAALVLAIVTTILIGQLDSRSAR